MSKLIIKEDSIENVVKIHQTIHEFIKYERADFEEKYQDSKKLILVAYWDQQPAGYLVAYQKSDDGSFYCSMVGVNPIFRRQGILKNLMLYLNNWAKDQGYKKITIKTRNSRREMLTYLVKNNFNFTEIHPHDSLEEYRILLEKLID